MKNIISVIIILLFFMLTCHKKNNEQAFSMNYIDGDWDSLKRQVIYKGDTNAYYNLFIGFIDMYAYEGTDSLMKYSKIMAEKYHYKRAYSDYFYGLCDKYDIDHSTTDLSKLNEKEKKEVIEWLKKMVENEQITQAEFDSIKN
jgi:hypothetical protein